ncbi:MAG: hypothetical protein K8R53_06315 [Bacteroidales bacterium]|nr:hypothetical protein [Bacteroidales bacterium]
MTDSHTQKKTLIKPTKARLIWGAVVFISGFLSPLFIPLVISSGLPSGWKTALSGLLAFGIPELFMIIAAGILGKSGFNYLKRYLALVLKRYGPPDTVSKTRYLIGLIMFFIPVLFALLLPYLFNVVGFISEYYFKISIGCDILLVISLFILGGDFWDKLRGLFVREARIYLPSNSQK